MASILRLRPSLHPPTNPSSHFLRLPPSCRSFHASPRPQFLDINTLLSSSHDVLQFVHASTGLPWALSLPLTALMMRVTIMLPISIYTRRRLQKSTELNPLVRAWGFHFRRSIMKKERGATPGYVEKHAMEAVRKKQREVNGRWSVQRWKQFFPPMIQIPVWFTLVETIRRMCGSGKGLLGIMFPDKVMEAIGVDKLSDFTLVSGSNDTSVLSGANIGIEPSLATEGILWFPNLLLPDPSLLGLPVLLSGAMLLNIIAPHREALAPRNKFFMRLHRVAILVGIAVAPLTMNMPTAILVYWFSSATFGYIQNYLLDRFMPIKEMVTPCQPVGNRIKQKQAMELLSKIDMERSKSPRINI